MNAPMHSPVELVDQTQTTPERSPLGAARIQRQLTVDEVARRADLPPEQVEWLEEGRVYRFASIDQALIAALLYGNALGIDGREARTLAGLPHEPREHRPTGRYVAATAAACACLLFVLAVTVFPGFGHGHGHQSLAGPPLLAPWRVSVDVLNGGGDINYTRSVASHVGAFGYRISRVAKANRFDYPETAVYYEPGGGPLGARLARQLGVPARPLPGGTNPSRLVVIVGPPRGP